MIEEVIDVIFMKDGQCVVTLFTGEERLERALRYAQGLFDERTVSIIRMRTEEVKP